ncbi:hypothetical protein A2230_00525 [candidate division WOR-1 bacterium RIFOXYA2_FULL_36_21]|uniref:Uncharacterized protein n=1 Tax=candidate division WOR-1 bacterium RIFOXYB2_FULL_36_35 TaxID=1802578 RepID=A0A1F4S7E1_UNCSA|nr:MAG: hypothetical protein A2230_00525 [candidate division WOR-1 bacterium RIFOXYA2_FULL_36_21]OGC15653.1 MAG: hypothetical protein A2290_06225 [candidate division WOR-1 bacterium RIFOXYB2_FULL_36_35]OGC16400.1 MAG: hypothetical protein A2282_00570 [candidate division WOR-1 bacterium RIFOXYA12_FULL_36_13]
MISIKKNIDQELKKAIKIALKTKIGISFDILGCLYIRELENGKIAVGSDLKKTFERLFSSNKLDEAIDLFIQKRKEFQLGFDFEDDRR